VGGAAAEAASGGWEPEQAGKTATKAPNKGAKTIRDLRFAMSITRSVTPALMNLSAIFDRLRAAVHQHPRPDVGSSLDSARRTGVP
jgi:hypothetical protein